MMDHSLVGVRAEAVEKSWTSSDALLYALGIGLGHDNPMEWLEYTTENSEGVAQKVFPTYAVMVAWGADGERRLGDFDPAMLVHAGQGITLHRPLESEGRARLTSQITGIYDKKSGALVTFEIKAEDPETGEPWVTVTSSAFIRGEGGFGGPEAPSEEWTRPVGVPDHEVVLPTWPGQALLYRLSGDRNPLHSDPLFAVRGGFDRPILHGLCTFGLAGRAVVSTLLEGDGDRLVSMSGRFSAPVTPGEVLTVSVWAGDGTGHFVVRREDGVVVLDRGLATLTPLGA